MKDYVIENISDGRAYVLRQRMTNGLNSGIYVDKDLAKVEEYAKQNEIEVAAIGSFYEVVM